MFILGSQWVFFEFQKKNSNRYLHKKQNQVKTVPTSDSTDTFKPKIKNIPTSDLLVKYLNGVI
jgi:hypothetical protein